MASETKFWIGIQPCPEDRSIIAVSPEHAVAVRSLGSTGEARVYDTNGKRWVRLHKAECGIPGCRCALEFVTGRSK